MNTSIRSPATKCNSCPGAVPSAHHGPPAPMAAVLTLHRLVTEAGSRVAAQGDDQAIEVVKTNSLPPAR